MSETAASPRIVVLGASGLIGEYIADDLMRRGMAVTPVARRFTPAQRARFGAAACERPLAALTQGELTRLCNEVRAQIVVNCLGVLQDNASDSTREVHEAFVGRLLGAMRSLPTARLLVHISVPGEAAEDRTAFSLTKRRAEQVIASSGIPYAILRPGFVLAPRAYGGSALLRALAALPFGLPASLRHRPFAAIAVEDIAETVARLIAADGPRAVMWDLMHPKPTSLGDVLDLLRASFGTAGQRSIPLPTPLLRLGAWAGDLAAWLGWRPSIRSTALAELLRGVTGDPRAWMDATGIAPRALDDVLRARPLTVQETWFARLYLLKALIVAGLVVFWCASALIALTAAFPAAVAILTDHGYAPGPARFMTVAGSVMDFSVGLATAFRRTARLGLVAGIAVSLFYMASAAVLTPDVWVEPLGALVKTFPAIILMLVALAIADDR
jgi:uncharacterized protein YbjT (DUF2867 family)